MCIPQQITNSRTRLDYQKIIVASFQDLKIPYWHAGTYTWGFTLIKHSYDWSHVKMD